MPQLGVPELLIILVIIVVIFGVGRLPEIGGAIGRSIREFKTSVKSEEEEESDSLTPNEPLNTNTTDSSSSA